MKDHMPIKKTNQVYVMTVEGDDEDTYAYYVGSSSNVCKRIASHKRQIRTDTIEHKAIKAYVRAFKKTHGRVPDVSFEILPTKYKSAKTAKAKETSFIKKFGNLNGTHNPVYNTCFDAIDYELDDIRLIVTMWRDKFSYNQIVRVVERKFPNFTKIDLKHVLDKHAPQRKKSQKLLEAQ